MSEKLTKTQRAALEWFAAKPGPVGLFQACDPSRVTIRRLHEAGYLNKFSPFAFGMIKYEINDAGREALKS